MIIPTAQDLLSRNAEYCQTHEPTPSFEEIYGGGNRLPTVAVITCADPRCIPEEFLKLDLLEAIVIRNAGSNVEEAMRSIIPIDNIVGLKEIMVINHTDCGATVYRDKAIKTVLKERAPNQSEQVEAMKFGEITVPLEDQIRSSVQWLKCSPFLREELKEGISGFVYDITTGSLKCIVSTGI